MTRGRTVWLVLLAVGLLIALLLRAPNKPRERSAPDARTAPSSAAPSDDPGWVEVEVADPNELDAAPAAPAPAASAAQPLATETDLNRALAGLWDTEPARALALAEEGEKRFGESPRAVERRLYEIKALVKLERIGKARSKAERYLATYPPGPMTDEVERLTGVHRRPDPIPNP